MIHEVIVTTISKDSQVHIAPMGIKIIDNQVIISPFRPSKTLENITENRIATINFIDDVRVFAGIVTKYKKDWELEDSKDKTIVPRLVLANTHYNVIAKNFKDDERRPNIVCDVSKKEFNKPFMGFNRAQFSVIEASVLVSRLKMLPIEKILLEIEYLKIGIDKTAGKRESEAWKWIEDKIQEFQKVNIN
ncbi:MAG: DUF447 family protein [Gammaproteobacteria bacterium]|jgi:uncharacterized protein|nr:DUF447 family protein [Gammaproteobacteria bacterium]MBT4462719.1 DUF447 family protein [Gammaproteobacteria bacterium]MBT4654405.1 DUF447 family protein [Gammaproteobacteria bacterium]MBT5117171.1 DUF447 family protein [Gammaproteobacteria bacterium]MBT5761846.1 DUF447 family protein [Gammaproteobacteria bacterium]